MWAASGSALPDRLAAPAHAPRDSAAIVTCSGLRISEKTMAKARQECVQNSED
jgi:hypothetical protein